ncbi:hypothetical protein LshimejAT787_0112950 [Lyophyllum shimeji]|uniref:C2H2-type domain-containing protein n=1 Tax=Lyophyllum shimeji TaxID=47721 RepID=A0A9P3PFA3_LYOSH|nr:hypothetical protein LshimejAT787_0112950 [Lyophyllum shimeji]
MPPAHDTYARELSELGRGYPLYYPEPHPEDGSVRLGDVGYTSEGAFYRLFNVSLPAEDPSQRFGVPNDFESLDLGVVRTFEAALQPGPLHSGTISTLEADIGTQGGILPAEASFTFKCRSKRGAILLLESQMTREQAVQRRRFENYLRRHCHSWHAFAESLDIDIGFGDLMLVTECSRTAAWSSAVYSNSSREFSLKLSVGNPLVPSAVGASASTGVERAGAVELRASVKHPSPGGQPLPDDHTVFIKAYRLGTRQAYLRSTVSLFVKARDLLFGSGVDDSSSLNQKTLHGTSDGSTQSSSGTPPGHSPRSGKHSDTMVIRPYNSDYHPSVALLGIAMEASDCDFVLVHDDEWCTASGDTEQFKIIEQYADFYFNSQRGMLAPVTLDVEDDPQPLQSDEIFNSMVMQDSSDFSSGIHSPDVEEGTPHDTIASEAPLIASEKRRKKAANYLCTKCDRFFTTEDNLNFHLEAHEGLTDPLRLFPLRKTIMLPNASHFTINDGTFTEIHSGSVDQSKHYHLYIFGSLQDEIQAGLRPPLDEGKLKELVASVEARIPRLIQEGEAAQTDIQAGQSDEAQGPEMPAGPEIIPTVKQLVIYTKTDNANTKLKKATNIVFTLTPPGSPPSGKSWPTIVWKTLQFLPLTMMKKDCAWSDETGISIVREKDNSTIDPDNARIVIKPRHMAVLLDGEDGAFELSVQVEMPLEVTAQFGLINKSSFSSRFALCVVDRSRPESDRFCPVIDLKDLKEDDLFMCGPPVGLQAYAVPADVKERRLIDTSQYRPLFPKPIDVRTLKAKTTFRLYSHPSGRVVLDKERIAIRSEVLNARHALAWCRLQDPWMRKI